MKISIIVAMAENRAIGYRNKLPWSRLPEDLKRFKEITLGHTIIMGRKTFESIGRALPGRKNIIVTSDKNYASKALDCIIVSSINDAIQKTEALDGDEIFVIGGAEIYKQFLPMAEKIYLTLVHKEWPGDAFFPDLDLVKWEEIERADNKDYSFVTLIKKQSPA